IHPSCLTHAFSSFVLVLPRTPRPTLFPYTTLFRSLTGPELRIYHDSTGNYEFQKGLQIIFFDNDGKETQRIKSDYGVQRSIEGITEFRKNVVINMADGSVIKTEELFYDEKKKEYYNSVPI